MNGHELFFYNTITRFVNPTQEEWQEFYRAFRSKTLAKNEAYVKEGTIADHLAFVAKGCLRMYYTIEGEEKCKDFQSEGQFTGSLYSFITAAPALFNVAAVEESEMLEISNKDLFALYDKFKVWERFGRIYTEQAFLYKERREASLLTELASVRYNNFVKEYPHWAQRIPQKYLASYLGIKAESLSRIRRTK